MTVALMWEAKAASCRGAELLEWARAQDLPYAPCDGNSSAPPRTAYWSSPGGTVRTTPMSPNFRIHAADLTARPVHRWRFESVT